LVYPDPATDPLTVETVHPGLHSIEITALNGQLLYSTIMEEPTCQLDLSSFQKGLYFITVRSRDKVWTEKIIKQYQKRLKAPEFNCRLSLTRSWYIVAGPGFYFIQAQNPSGEVYLYQRLARILPAYSNSYGTPQIILKRKTHLFRYWCLSPGMARAKSPALRRFSSPFSLTNAPVPSIT
jgi:hypothetical protein